MAERPEDLNLPNAVITRIIKEANIQRNGRKCGKLPSQERTIENRLLEDVKSQHIGRSHFVTFSASKPDEIDSLIKIKRLTDFSEEIIHKYSEYIFASYDDSHNLFEIYKQQNTIVQNVKDKALLSLLQDTKHKVSLCEELYTRAKLFFAMSEKEMYWLFHFLEKSLLNSDLATLLSNHYNSLIEKHRKIIELFFLEQDTRLKDLLDLEQILKTYGVPIINPAIINKFEQAIVQDVKTRVLSPVVKNVTVLARCQAALKTMSVTKQGKWIEVVLSLEQEIKTMAMSTLEKDLRKQKMSAYPEDEWTKALNQLARFLSGPGCGVKSITACALEQKIKTATVPGEISVFEQNMNSLMLASVEHYSVSKSRLVSKERSSCGVKSITAYALEQKIKTASVPCEIVSDFEQTMNSLLSASAKQCSVSRSKLESKERSAFDLNVKSEAVFIIKEFVTNSNSMSAEILYYIKIKDPVESWRRRILEKKLSINSPYFRYMRARRKFGFSSRIQVSSKPKNTF